MSDAEHFLGVCWPLNVFFGETSAHVSCPFFNWITWGFLALRFLLSSAFPFSTHAAYSKESSL